MTDTPCICISLRKASRKMTSLYDDALAPAGINLAQFSLLRNVNRHGPVSLTRLSEITELDRSTLGRNVRVLERMGLMAATDSGDKREASVALTPGGKHTLDHGEPLWAGVQSGIHDKLGATGAAQLEALLGALQEA
jgi:DNA-binding MarR family transcriptional regulator